MIYPIAVACNYLSLLRKPLTPNYRGRNWGVYLRGFFNFLTVIVLLTKVRPHACGCEEQQRVSLNQGGRLHEGATSSDKQTCILMMVVAESLNSGLINKAVARIKGRTPIRTVVRTASMDAMFYMYIIIDTVALVWRNEKQR